MCVEDFFGGTDGKRQGRGTRVSMFFLCSSCARSEPVVSESCSVKSRSKNIDTLVPLPCRFPDFGEMWGAVRVLFIG